MIMAGQVYAGAPPALVINENSIKEMLRRREQMDRIPKDPVMLLSFINLKLRDYGKDLAGICEELDVRQEEIEEKLAAIDYHYDREKNQFV